MPDTFRIQMAKEYAMSRAGVIGKLYHSIVEVEPLKDKALILKSDSYKETVGEPCY